MNSGVPEVRERRVAARRWLAAILLTALLLNAALRVLLVGYVSQSSGVSLGHRRSERAATPQWFSRTGDYGTVGADSVIDPALEF